MEFVHLFIAGVLPSVPDSGATGLLLGIAILFMGAAARFIKNKKK